MRAIQDRKTKKWKFGEAGEYLYASKTEAEEQGRKQISINLKSIESHLSDNKNLSK